MTSVADEICHSSWTDLRVIFALLSFTHCLPVFNASISISVADPYIWAFTLIVGYLVILFLGRNIFFEGLLHMVLVAKLNITIEAFKKRNNIFPFLPFIDIDFSYMI